jgi:hypothetical protein
MTSLLSRLKRVDKKYIENFGWKTLIWEKERRWELTL